MLQIYSMYAALKWHKQYSNLEIDIVTFFSQVYIVVHILPTALNTAN
jgi:hypothetical protein